MKRLIFSVFLVVATAVHGQTFTKSLPANYDTLDGNYATSFPFSTLNQTRWQWFYDWTQFYHQCPQTLLQIDFRRSTGALFGGGTWNNVTIKMSSLPGDHLAASNTFANNVGADAVVVYSGPLTLAPFAGTTLPTGTPAPWLLNIPLQVPFEFDPTRRKDLCVDVTVTGTPTSSPGFILDGQFPTPFGGRVGNASASGATALTGDTVNLDAVPIMNLTYQLGASTKFNMTALTQGLGVGDLFLGASNVPAGTVVGFTLISATASPIFGKGPAFGIMPDPLTFSIFTLPPSFGNPLAWTYPALGVAYPDAPVTLPPGAASFLAGQTWDLVTVAFDPSFFVLGVTAPVQLAW